MHNDVMSGRQMVLLVALFLFGNNIVMGVSTGMGQDAWISVLMAMAFVLPVLLVYARIVELFPGMGFYEVILDLFGPVAGRLIIALFTWYAIHLSALVLRSFSEFIEIIAMPETPQLPLMVAMILVAAYIAKSGPQILGRWGVMAMAVLGLIVIMTIVLSMDHLEIDNLLPVMEHSIPELAASARETYAYPFAELVVFLPIASGLRKGSSPYKIFLYGVLIGGLVLIVFIFRNVACMGVEMFKSEYFPSYTSARIIQVADFLSRIEGSISINFVLAGITKLTICLMAATKGFASIVGVRQCRYVMMPVCLLVLALCTIVHRNIMEMYSFVAIYPFYAFPFQVVIPVLIWVTAEIKIRLLRKAGENFTSRES